MKNYRNSVIIESRAQIRSLISKKKTSPEITFGKYFRSDENNLKQTDIIKNFYQPSNYPELTINNLNKNQIFKLLILIIKKNEEKSANEIDFLNEHLSKIKFMEEIKNEIAIEVYLDLLKEIKYEYYQAGKRKFYIVLKGSVLILTPNKFSKQKTLKTDDSSEEKDYSPKRRDLVNFVKIFSERITCDKINLEKFQKEIVENNMSNETIIIKESLEDNPSFRIVNIQEKGSYFGEIALRTGGERLATTITLVDTHLAVIRADIYNRILKNFDEKIYLMRINFLKSVNIFNNVPESALAIIEKHIKTKHFIKNQVIYKENSESDGLYIVLEGEVLLIKNLKLKKKEVKRLSIDQITNESYKTNEIFLQILNKNTRDKLIGEYEKKKEILILKKGQIFGEEEIMEGIPRKFTVIAGCLNTIVFFISKKDILESQKSKKMQESIIEEIEVKKSFRISQEKINSTRKMRSISLENTHKNMSSTTKTVNINNTFNSFQITTNISKNFKNMFKKRNLSVGESKAQFFENDLSANIYLERKYSGKFDCEPEQVTTLKMSHYLATKNKLGLKRRDPDDPFHPLAKLTIPKNFQPIRPKKIERAPSTPKPWETEEGLIRKILLPPAKTFGVRPCDLVHEKPFDRVCRLTNANKIFPVKVIKEKAKTLDNRQTHEEFEEFLINRQMRIKDVY